jgi:hypothetical protein
VWSVGDGASRIADQGNVDGTSSNVTDTLVIHGLTPAQVTVTRNPDPEAHDLVLTAAGQSPIVLVGQTAPGSNSVIEKVVFDNSTVWDYSDLLLQADGGIPTAPNGTTARSFAGAAASSTLAGTASDDTYFWGAGEGNDTIAEGNVDPWAKTDTLRLVGLNASDVTFNIIENSNRDLLITNKATGETLTVTGQFYSASNNASNTWAGGGTGVERIVFADGTVWNPQQILNHSVYLAAPGATSVSNLGLGDGMLATQASPGVTTLNGLDGFADTFVWTPGDGSDTILDFNTPSNPIDTLRLAGVAVTDIQLGRSGNDLLVTDKTTGETITVRFEFPDIAAGNGVERIVFDDGTVWNRATINATAVTYGTSGNDTISTAARTPRSSTGSPATTRSTVAAAAIRSLSGPGPATTRSSRAWARPRTSIHYGCSGSPPRRCGWAIPATTSWSPARTRARPSRCSPNIPGWRVPEYSASSSTTARCGSSSATAACSPSTRATARFPSAPPAAI